MFVPTDEIALPHAKVKREAKRAVIVEKLTDADGWLSAAQIAGGTDMNRKFARQFCDEMAGEWLSKRVDTNGGFEFKCRGEWLVTESSGTVHTEMDCMFLDSPDTTIRQATAQEAALADECSQCADVADEPFTSGRAVARRVADD